MSNLTSLLHRMNATTLDYGLRYKNVLTDFLSRQFYDFFLELNDDSVLCGMIHGMILEPWLYKRIRSVNLCALYCHTHVRETDAEFEAFVYRRHHYREIVPPTPEPQRGHILEERALQLYEEQKSKYGFYVKQVRHLQNPKIPWICASPDGMVFQFGVISHGVEVKSPFMRFPDGSFKRPKWLSRFGDEWSINRLSSVYSQVQMYMAISNLDRWDVVVYDEQDDSIIIAQVARNPVFIKHMLDQLAHKFYNIMLPILAKKAILRFQQ